jgi:hypothetical protein
MVERLQISNIISKKSMQSASKTMDKYSGIYSKYQLIQMA